MVKLLVLSDLNPDLKPMAFDHEGQRIGVSADLVISAGERPQRSALGSG